MGKSVKFIDLFAGVGGFRYALQNIGGECVFSSEWDKFAQQTYKLNYGEVPFGDITLRKIIFLMNLIYFAQDFLVKHFL